MLKNIVIIFAIVAVFSFSTSAETITGLVTDNEDTPLVGATVSLVGMSQQFITDDNGNFEISNISLPISITVSHVGYSSVTINNFASQDTIILYQAITHLNSMVVTANRYEKEAYKVTQPITIAGSEEIEKKGHTIISDIVREFPGVDMNDAGSFRARPVIRGLYGTRVLVLLDGERLNDQREVVDFAGVSMSLVDVNEIERVEVVNGPSSVLYGSDAMGGVINIFTKKNRFTEIMTPWAKYSSRYSTADEQHSNRLDLGVNSERWTVSAGFQYREAGKDFSPPDDWTTEELRYGVFSPAFYDSFNVANNTNFERDKLANSRARVNNLDFRVGHKINNKHMLDLDLGFFRASDIGYPGVPNDSTPFLFLWPNHDRDNVSLRWTGRGLTENLVRIETKFYYEKISKDFFTNFYEGIVIPLGPPFPPPPTLTPLTTLSETEVTKIGLNFQELYKLTDNSTITFGFDGWREEIKGKVEDISRIDGFGPFPIIDTTIGASVPENRWYALGIYASGEKRFESFEINAGLRFDNFWINTETTDGYVDENDTQLPTEDQKYSALNGSIGLIVPLGNGINAVSNVGSAYRVPNVVERFFYGSASGRETRPNPDIDPERAITIDAGFKAVHENVNYSLIGFYSDYKDFSQLQRFDTTTTGSSLWRFENVDDVRIYGFEGVIEANFDNGLYGNLSFALQRGDNKVNDQPIFVSPVKTILQLGYRYPKNGLFGEVTIRKVEDQDRIPNVSTLDDIATKGFTVVNLTAGAELFDQIKFSVNVNNIFDEVYSEPFNGRNPDNPIAEPGRNLVLSLTASI